MSTVGIYRDNAFGPARPPRLQTGGVAVFANGTGTATFDHLRWTQYPDPGLSLATVRRAGSTFISWNANLPSAATSLGVDVSTDGITWTDVSQQNGQPIPGINQQDPPWMDVFATDQSFQYGNVFQGYLGYDTFIRANQTGWNAGTDGQTWGIVVGSPFLLVNSNLGLLTGTTSLATVQYGANTATDMEVLSQVAFSTTTVNTGLALRIQANGDCYRAWLHSNTFGIDKCVGGVFTTLVSTPFTAGANTGWMVRFRVKGTTLEAKVWFLGSVEPGAWTLSTTDATISAAGGFGVNSLLALVGDSVAYIGFSAAQVVDTTNPTGQPATTTLDLPNSRITLAAGVQAMYLYNAFLRADWDLLCDMDQADVGGLVFAVVDYLNFYSVVIADGSAANGTPNTITVYKTVAGVRSQLAQATNIGFLRGTYHRLRVQILSGVLTVLFDGSQVATYTDGSPLGMGQAGLYNSGGTVRYYQVWIQPQGDVLTGTPAGNAVNGTFLYTRQRLATSDGTVTPQLLDLTTSIYDGNIGPGQIIQSPSYQNTFCDKNLDDLIKQSGSYAWWVDPTFQLMFRDRQTTPAPWILQSSKLLPVVDLEVDSTLLVDVQNDLYRNRQILLNVLTTATFSDSSKGDGQSRSFTLSYPVAPNTTPVVTLNGNPQTVALKGLSGAQWYFAYNDPVIAQDASGTVLTSSDTWASSYTGVTTTTYIANNVAGQTALALVEGGTGIVEAVEDVSAKKMAMSQAIIYAQQLLARYSVLGRTLTFTTYRNGLSVGQILPCFVPEENLNNAQMLITAIDVTMRTIAPNTQLYAYAVTATELPNRVSPAKLLASAIPLT